MFEIGGKQIPATLAELVEPERAALLLWDMENAIAPQCLQLPRHPGQFANARPRSLARAACRFSIPYKPALIY